MFIYIFLRVTVETNVTQAHKHYLLLDEAQKSMFSRICYLMDSLEGVNGFYTHWNKRHNIMEVYYCVTQQSHGNSQYSSKNLFPHWLAMLNL